MSRVAFLQRECENCFAVWRNSPLCRGIQWSWKHGAWRWTRSESFSTDHVYSCIPPDFIVYVILFSNCTEWRLWKNSHLIISGVKRTLKSPTRFIRVCPCFSNLSWPLRELLLPTNCHANKATIMSSCIGITRTHASTIHTWFLLYAYLSLIYLQLMTQHWSGPLIIAFHWQDIFWWCTVNRTWWR